MASTEDMRVLLERTGAMERAQLDQEARADQVTAALHAMQQQQQQSVATAQHARSRAAAAQTAGTGVSAVVDTRPLGKPVTFDGRERRLLWSRRQSPEGSAGSGRIQGRGTNARHPHGPGHARCQCSGVPRADQGPQKLLEHTGDTEATLGRVRAKDAIVLCCKNSFTTVSPAVREQRWTSSRCSARKSVKA